jgi:hypothetical protein
MGLPAISEDFDDRVEVEINARRRVPAVVAKAGEHFVHAVGGRRQALRLTSFGSTALD